MYLLERELFGYPSGVANPERHKVSRFEYTCGGTLFLDEVCELSPRLQIKLLRKLREGNAYRLAGKRDLEIDVRIISSSNRNLEFAVATGRLRKDLYYSLKALTICLPPLRERAEDIPPLCEHFVQKYSRMAPKTVSGIAVKTLEYLRGHTWPENVRELENCIELAIEHAKTDWILPEDLPATITTARVCLTDEDHSRLTLT